MAGASGPPQWSKPAKAKWDYSRFATPGARAPTPDQVFDMTFAKDNAALATVVDKELVSEHKLQRYGTQFKVVDGGMAMIAVEDPAGLDARRAMVFLMPIKAYEGVLEQTYHLKVSDGVVDPK